jgi:23S rRNA (cytidine1920-2'-O)/16S rRNA (cytidine1409-2'-O)-methyltransferase
VTADPSHAYVGRGGLKLRHALDAFHLDAAGWTCADFGCNVGGFTDCLLQAGASRVTAIDTGYGALAWRLRNDPRVRVMERTNALHAAPPAEPDRVDLVVVDMAWTPQRLCIPAALCWLRPGGRIISLVKPHYEAAKRGREKALLKAGVLDEPAAERIVERVLADMPPLGARVLGCVKSPISGGKGRGNAEWLVLLAPA